MGFDYQRIRDNVAEPKLSQFGTSGYLSMNGSSTGKPWDSQLGNDSQLPITVVRTIFKKSDNQGTLVEKNDVMFLVSTEGVSIDPALADRMTVDNVTYQIIRIDPLKPGPVVMLWKVHARK